MRQTFIKTLRSYIGVPYRHLGRSRRGIDCLGLLICAANDCGLRKGFDFKGYKGRPDGSLLELMAQEVRKIPLPSAQPGDILVFKGPERLPCHTAVLTTPTAIIHAWGEFGRVSEHQLKSFLTPIAAFDPFEVLDG